MDERELDELSRRALRELRQGSAGEARGDARLAGAMADGRLDARFARAEGGTVGKWMRTFQRRAALGLALPLVASAALAVGALLDRRPALDAERFEREWRSEYDATAMGCLSALSATMNLHYKGE
jgi:hypothetical protein